MRQNYHQELLHPPSVDAPPLPGHGGERYLRVQESCLSIGERVDQCGDGLGQIFLDERLVRHPHAVEQSFPQLEQFILAERCGKFKTNRI